MALALSAEAPAPDYPPQSLLLLVASWCAPCRDELKRLDAISAVAQPYGVRIVPVDRSRATLAMVADVPAARIVTDAALVARLAAQTGGLPFSVMTDRQGRRCAAHARPLDAAAVAAMRARCG